MPCIDGCSRRLVWDILVVGPGINIKCLLQPTDARSHLVCYVVFLSWHMQGARKDKSHGMSQRSFWHGKFHGGRYCKKAVHSLTSDTAEKVAAFSTWSWEWRKHRCQQKLPLIWRRYTNQTFALKLPFGHFWQSCVFIIKSEMSVRECAPDKREIPSPPHKPCFIAAEDTGQSLYKKSSRPI